MVNKRFFKSNKVLSVKEIVEIIPLELGPNANLDDAISDISSLEEAGTGQISFFSNGKYKFIFENSRAEYCITSSEYVSFAPKNMKILLSKNPYKDYALVSQLFYNSNERNNFISKTAVVGKNCKIGENCSLGEYVVIGDNVTIGNNTIINHHVVIGDNCLIGNENRISSSVVISHAIIGNRVIVHSGACIGQDGFGFASDHTGHVKILQLGGVVIGDDVEIGSNTTIDRGSSSDTVIGSMTKIDNLVQIGHNVVIGKGCFIVSQVGISGSAKIGDFVVLGGQVGVAGHLKVADFVQVAAKSGIHNDIKTPKQVYAGFPLMPIRDWHKQNILLKKMLNKKKTQES